MISTQFDINDFEKPIKYFMEDIYYPLLSGKGLQSIIWYKRNQLELNDNIFGLYNTETVDYFYQLSSQTYLVADPDTGPGKGFYFFQMFKMDKQVDIYSRDVYTVMGVLRDVGGFYNSLFFAGLLIYSRFQGTIIFSKLVSKLYQIEQVDNDGDGSGQHEEQQPTPRKSIKGLQKKKTVTSQKLVKKMVKNIKEEMLVNLNQPELSTIQKIKSYLGNRWRLEMTYMDNIKFVIDKVVRFICRCCTSKRSRQTTTLEERKVELYLKGERKIKNELDCISILTKLRYLDVLVSLFLDSNQKLLLGFQRKNVIQEDTGSYSSDDEQETTKDIISKLNFKDPAAANILNEERLDEALEELQKKKKLTPLDQKILLGIVSRAPGKYTESNLLNEKGKIEDSSSSDDSPNPEEIAKKRQLRALNNSAISGAPTNLTSIQSKITNVVNTRIKQMMQEAMDGDTLTEGGIGAVDLGHGDGNDNAGEYWDITTNHGRDTSQYIPAKPAKGIALRNGGTQVKKTVSAVTPDSAKHLQERDDWNTSQRDLIPVFEPLNTSGHLKTLQAAPSPLKRKNNTRAFTVQGINKSGKGVVSQLNEHSLSYDDEA